MPSQASLVCRVRLDGLGAHGFGRWLDQWKQLRRRGWTVYVLVALDGSHAVAMAHSQPQEEPMYEIVIEATGDRATALSPPAALTAARTLARDGARAQGREARNRRSTLIACDGVYQGWLTAVAREGRSL